jgi:hypothetical protein
VNPPVDAPMSSATAPAGSIPNASSPFTSLSAPRDTYGWSSSRSTTSAPSATGCPAFETGWPSTSTVPARISARARSRLGASPRATSS